MATPTTADSQAAERRRRREYRKGFVVFISCGLVATLANVLLGDGLVPPFLRRSLSTTAAISLAVAFVAAVALASWFMRGLLDEHETQASIYGQAIACAVVIVGYPVWYLLWKGGLTPEPSHAVLFATLLLVSWTGYVYRKYS